MISVIIPLYNKEKIINKTLQSVLFQNFNNFEIVIVDDGSTDDSIKVVNSICDDRIHLIRQKNGGPGKARNTGVAYAKGEWILFLDADDELADGALNNLNKLAEANAYANIIDGSFCVRTTTSNKETIYSEGLFINNNYKSFFFRETLPSTGHTLFKADLIRKYPYKENIRRYEDVEMIMRILRDAKIVTTSKITFYVNSDFSSASTARKTIKEDFLGHLDFKNKSFWEKMSLYQFYLWERNHYPKEVNKLYPTLRWRYDLLLLNKILHLLKNHHVL
jgi:glycosyltransferase involved in cell wall biosynthesis